MVQHILSKIKLTFNYENHCNLDRCIFKISRTVIYQVGFEYLCVITNLSKGNVINNGSFFVVVVVFVAFLAIHGKGKDKNSIYTNF